MKHLSCRPFVLAALAVLALASAGCESITTRSYDLTIQNHLSRPITLFLTKDGPPDEPGWQSPEELAANAISLDHPHDGQIVGPGQTMVFDNIQGQFRQGTTAILRVYEKTGRLEDIAALSPGNPERTDVILVPGVNNIVIDHDQFGLTAQRQE